MEQDEIVWTLGKRKLRRARGRTGGALRSGLAPARERRSRRSTGRAPASGSAAESSLNFINRNLATERANLIYVDILFGTENGDYDREADCGFGGGHRDHQKGEDMAGIIEPGAGEREKQ